MQTPLNPNKLTFTGVLLFIIGVLVTGSAFRGFRPEVAGLLIHPCLIPIMLFGPFVAYARISLFPVRILASLMFFVATFSFAALSTTISIGETVKIVVAMMMIVVPALMVRSRTDFAAGTLGLVIAVLILSVRGLQSEALSEGLNPMEVANKNSFSLYALPSVLLGGVLIFEMPGARTITKLICAVAAAAASIAILLGGNRSGWLGVGLVLILILWPLIRQMRFTGIVFVAVIAAATAYWIANFGDTTVAQRRIQDTRTGRNADNLRVWLLLTCFQIGIENPIAGVSPQALPMELGRRVPNRTDLNIIDSHNVFGHVIAGCGVICFAGLIATGVAMWRWPLPKDKSPDSKMLRSAVRTMHMLIMLWVFRGMFTREILFNPGFCISLGLAIGWCMFEESFYAQRQPKRDDPLVVGALAVH